MSKRLEDWMDEMKPEEVENMTAGVVFDGESGLCEEKIRAAVLSRIKEEKSTPGGTQKVRHGRLRGPVLRRVMVFAACFVLIGAALTAILLFKRQNEPSYPWIIDRIETIEPGGVKDTVQNTSEIYEVRYPAWSEKNAVERYGTVELMNVSYSFRGESDTVGAHIGELLDTVEVSGWEYADEKAAYLERMNGALPEDIPGATLHTAKAHIFSIAGIDPACAVAVRYEGDEAYYPQVNSHYPFETLGDFLDKMNFAEYASLGTLYYDYVAENGDYVQVRFDDVSASVISSLLLSKREAVNHDEDTMHVHKMSFSLNFPVLGYENISLGVSEDGYLITNLLDTGKYFFIGTEATDAFFDYVEKNCEGHAVIYRYVAISDGSADMATVTAVTSLPHEPK